MQQIIRYYFFMQKTFASIVHSQIKVHAKFEVNWLNSFFTIIQRAISFFFFSSECELLLAAILVFINIFALKC